MSIFFVFQRAYSTVIAAVLALGFLVAPFILWAALTGRAVGSARVSTS